MIMKSDLISWAFSPLLVINTHVAAAKGIPNRRRRMKKKDGLIKLKWFMQVQVRFIMDYMEVHMPGQNTAEKNYVSCIARFMI